MSLVTTRAGYITWFAIGVLCIGLWIFLTIYCFTVTMFTSDYYNNLYSTINLDNIMRSYAGIGLIPLVIGATLIYKTYQFFIPQKDEGNISTSARVCPLCGAVLAEDAVVCEKCKQPIDDD